MGCCQTLPSPQQLFVLSIHIRVTATDFQVSIQLRPSVLHDRHLAPNPAQVAQVDVGDGNIQTVMATGNNAAPRIDYLKDKTQISLTSYFIVSIYMRQGQLSSQI